MGRVVDSLTKLYVENGGTAVDVKGMSKAGIIDAMANAKALNAIVLGTPAQSKTYWGTRVSAMQGSDVAINDGKITGTIKYLAEGSLVDVWKNHHFIALTFTDSNTADKVEVGIKNVGELDNDMDAVISIEDKNLPLRVITTKGNDVRTQLFDLSGLTLQAAE